MGLLLLHFTSKAQFEGRFLLIMLAVVTVVSVLDYVLPILGTKMTGGSKYGIWGSMIGLLVGIFIFPPFGIIIGPFVGAVIAELLKVEDLKKAFKAGLGAFLGFMFSTAIKLSVSGAITYYFVVNLF